MDRKPPKIAEWIIHIIVRFGNRQTLIGDLEEEYRYICDEQGKIRANLWYSSQIFPDKPFNYYLLDEDFNEQFINIERSRDIISYFTFLAIFIACLGLFGMVAYAAEKRTKEIGIRKP